MQHVQAHFPAAAATPAAVARAALDPLAALLACLVLAFVFNDYARDDFVLAALTCLLMDTGKTPFRRFSRQAALRILLNWTVVMLLVYALPLSQKTVRIAGARDLEMPVLLLWALTAPAVLILLHLVSPRVAPHVRSVFATRKAVVVCVTLEYLRSWSLVLDLLILWKTAVMLVRGDPKAY